MSEVISPTKFLELIKRSGLIEEEELSKYLRKVNTEQGSAVLDNQTRLAELMVEDKLLTRWQADKLLAGKHKGFRLGKYKLLEQIGKGGMSSVYRAEHMLMRRSVAIKVLPQNRVADSSYLERFRLEARAVAKLDDPNIVRAYDIDSDNDGKTHYIVMEYVNGDDLHQLVSKNGPLDYETAADYVAQAALGLQHAHEQGLVHRDIKPANFLVDRNQTVKMLDLGLAKIDEELTSLTLANDENVLGTADYLAPEQALNSHAADSRADIYSLGCTLYFLLTGHPPFPEGSISERLLKHQTAQPETIYKARPDAPPSLVQICQQMMAKKPDERFQSALEVSERLAVWLAERGRKPGGGRITDRAEGSGVGSGLGSGAGSGMFKRFAIGPPTPTPVSSPSSETLSSGNRDTAKLSGESSDASALEEDIGLAPLDEEDASVISGLSSKSKKVAADKKKSSGSSSVVTGGKKPASAKSLIEEEFHDPEEEAIARKVAQRAKYNPLMPPGYTPPGQSAPWGLLLAIGAGVLLLVAIILMLLA